MAQCIEPKIGCTYRRTDNKRRTGDRALNLACGHVLKVISINDLLIMVVVVAGDLLTIGRLLTVPHAAFTDEYFEPCFEQR